MRSDNTIGEKLKGSDAWQKDPLTGRSGEQVVRYSLPDLERGKMSFSGKERNHLFLNLAGKSFKDISAVAGVDAIQDSRSIAICDFDRDGWQDIILVNTNSPVLMIYQNKIGSRQKEAANVVAFEFVGGNRESTPSEQFGSRDGFGVRVSLTAGGHRQTREYRCGEGLAAQNSGRLIFGLGDGQDATDVEIQWPSGIKQTIPTVQPGSLVKVFEDVDSTPEKSGVSITKYLMPKTEQVRKAQPPLHRKFAGRRFQPISDSTSQLNVYTSMATWCASCKSHLPGIKKLKSMFDTSKVQLYAVPVDPEDTTEKLNAYLEQMRPEYKLLDSLDEEQVKSFRSLIQTEFKSDALPMTIVTQQDGAVVAILRGIPSVSDLAKWLR